ncbi:hypothetical protein I4F81_003619 [Pyropia yezoensis]|uniref:Uncharacterized protein n=1 Tax=Pyropia yezoensis TaxID=2788 RepID=A0ACC3BTG4_PYRYE|nr:hypothetical protein I4F81_003619 [Neopyropia yezoensis]
MPLESWRCRRPLRGHTGDVTDLAWSPNCARLASSSIDNLVLVWAAADGRRVATLAGHAGLVKGVAWDPVGRFIASQGDDRSVIIWRTADWKAEKRLEKPFADAVHHVHSLSFFLRLSWSPCGSQLLTPNAFQRPNHVAPMFSRSSGFTSQMDFVGHRGPVVATRFSPRLYVPLGKPPPALAAPPGGGGGAAGGMGAAASANGGVAGVVAGAEGESGWKDGASYTCLALGSKDRGATLWKASAATPFLSLAQMFDSDLVDLSWGADGYTMAASSTDGRVVLMQFEPRELGVVVPRAQEARILGTIARSFGGTASVAQLPESTTTLAMEDALMRQQPPALLPAGGVGGAPAAPAAAPDPGRKRKAPDDGSGGGAPSPSAPSAPTAAALHPVRTVVLISQQRELYRSIVLGRVTPSGEPLLALSDGSTFLYDRRLAAWLRVAGGGDATYSEFTFAAATAEAAGSGGLVHRLQARAAATEAAAAAGRSAGGASAGGGGATAAAASAALTALAAEADGRRAAVETLGHLETLVWTAARLRSAAELKYYLACYAARLASVAGDAAGGVGGGGSGVGGVSVSPVSGGGGGGDRDPDAAAAAARLRELCDGLMEAAATGAPGGPAGVTLLRSTVLPVVSANRGMQRLVAGYTDSLRELPQAAGGAEGGAGAAGP